MLRSLTAAIALLAGLLATRAEEAPLWSAAGFFPLEESGRTVLSANGGWRFLRGDAQGAEGVDFDDSDWLPANLPHGLELLPEQASGGINYQGPAWYRTRMTVPESWTGRRVVLHFEAIMGKSRIWVDGRLVKENSGGYLPVIIDLTPHVTPGRAAVIAVRTDNSDDTGFPPGKPQPALDFCYFGGIYRDAWLIATAQQHITDANEESITAGGGVFFRTEQATQQSAEVTVEVHIANRGREAKSAVLSLELVDPNGKVAARAEEAMNLAAGSVARVERRMTVKNPTLWHPEHPHLYSLTLRLRDSADGKPLDGGIKRVGLRTIEFRGKDGFYVNGEPFEGPLIGANRHQDFAVIGNALPNSLHRRDAKLLRSAGFRIVRSAHYPQDPAFMDACDEYGIFVIVATPGWQHWNDDPAFADLVERDVRNMVRRDRNHASVILWEPVLNETAYPAEFARHMHAVVHQEWPHPGCHTACDLHMPGQEVFDLVYSHPLSPAELAQEKRCVFTREWGDNVDDWSSHNSPSRVARGWGEGPQMIQFRHYARPPYAFTSLDALHRQPRQHVGGALWHPFDHQRGYHPDPFYGGILDAFRQPKTSHWLFTSQRSPNGGPAAIKTGPLVKILNEMTPFSAPDVVVATNCEEVRLFAWGGDPPAEGTKAVIAKPVNDGGMPHPPVVFEGAFDFMKSKALGRGENGDRRVLVAEGLIGGKVVARDVRRPALRPQRLVLSVETEGVPMTADGSDLVAVVASLVDENGSVKRLSEGAVRFSVSAGATIVGDERIGANPKALSWGTAPVLIRAGTEPGPITVRAEPRLPGTYAPAAAEITWQASASRIPFVTAPVAQRDFAAHGGGDRSSARDTLRGDVERQQDEMEKKSRAIQ